jgi:transcriptional repressor NrdR
MRCPFCGDPEDKVIDSRSIEDDRATRRRRECTNCGQRYTTFERLEEVQLLVTKRSGEVTEFDREKLLSGIRKACTNRPVTEAELDKLADDVVEAVRQGGNKIRSSDLGREVLERLRSLDEVAYLRFASVYKDFQELDDFEKELGELQKKVPPKQGTGAQAV